MSGGQGRGAARTVHSIAPAAVTLCTFQLDALGTGISPASPLGPTAWFCSAGTWSQVTLSGGTLTHPLFRQPSPQLRATFPGALLQKTCAGDLVPAKKPGPSSAFLESAQV